MTPHTVEQPYIRFNGVSRYARHGDTVSLSAERIDNYGDVSGTSGNLVLQLWACSSPYAGGNLEGWKLVEQPVGVLQAGNCLAQVTADVPAQLPEAGDFAMVLVIAEWDGGGFNRIHDFHNYPCRDAFIHPRLEGLVSYRLTGEDRVVVDVERISNPREPDNMSGTLSLELWALAEPYVGGDFHGDALAGMTLGPLAGGASWQNGTCELTMTRPPDGSYTLVLMLREWVGNGYITRDHCNFAHPVTFPIMTSDAGAAESLSTSGPRDQTPSPAQSSAHADAAADELPDAVPAAPRESPRTPTPTRVEQLKTFAQRLWETIKRNW